MSRFSGLIGFSTVSETYPGVWTETINERRYYGDLLKNRTNFINNAVVNPGVTLNHTISILVDAFCLENSHNMRYVTVNGVKWRINNFELAHPRMIVNVGGVYND